MKTFNDYLEMVQMPYLEGVSSILEKIKQFLRGSKRTEELIDLVLKNPTFALLSDRIFSGRALQINDKTAVKLYNTWKHLREKAIANALSTGDWTEKEKRDMIDYLNWVHENAEGFVIQNHDPEARERFTAKAKRIR
jgi:hypothetical protein